MTSRAETTQSACWRLGCCSIRPTRRGIVPIYLVPQRSPTFRPGNQRLRVFIDEHGISHECLSYFDRMGFLASHSQGAPAGYASSEWLYHPQPPTRVEVVDTLGVSGFSYGPNVHVIDRNALADAPMARMPLEDSNHWRIGHFRHIIPDGYLETLESGPDRIRDPLIAHFYEKLAFVITGDVWVQPGLRSFGA